MISVAKNSIGNDLHSVFTFYHRSISIPLLVNAYLQCGLLTISSISLASSSAWLFFGFLEVLFRAFFSINPHTSKANIAIPIPIDIINTGGFDFVTSS